MNRLTPFPLHLPGILAALSLLLLACGGVDDSSLGDEHSKGSGSGENDGKNNGQNEGDHEAPADLHILVEYAGTYKVTGPGTGHPAYCNSCNESNRNHERGTIVIHENGAIDFDIGISFQASDIEAIYDRKMVDFDRRIAVNYGPSDADERIRIYLDETLEAVEIIHNDGQGSTTRSMVIKQ